MAARVKALHAGPAAKRWKETTIAGPGAAARTDGYRAFRSQ